MKTDWTMSDDTKISLVVGFVLLVTSLFIGYIAIRSNREFNECKYSIVPKGNLFTCRGTILVKEFDETEHYICICPKK